MAPVTIIRWDFEKTSLLPLHEKLEALFHGDDMEDMEMAVVGVIGQPKSGKSFLLNYILRFFRNPSEGMVNWMKDGDPKKPLEGFPCNCNSNDTSELVCAWDEPFILEKDDGKKTMLFLLEFGSGDSVRELYQSLALRICSLVIFNESSSTFKSTLKNVMNDHKELCLTNEFSVPRIAFLVRDFLGKFTKKDAFSYLQHECKNIPFEADDLDAFLNNTSCGLLPVPTFKNSTGSFDSMDTGFIKSFAGFIVDTLQENTISFQPPVLGKKQCMKTVGDAINHLNCILIRSLPSKNGTRDIPAKPDNNEDVHETSDQTNLKPIPDQVEDTYVWVQQEETEPVQDGYVQTPNSAIGSESVSQSPPKALVKSKLAEDPTDDKDWVKLQPSPVKPPTEFQPNAELTLSAPAASEEVPSKPQKSTRTSASVSALDALVQSTDPSPVSQESFAPGRKNQMAVPEKPYEEARAIAIMSLEAKNADADSTAEYCSRKPLAASSEISEKPSASAIVTPEFTQVAERSATQDQMHHGNGPECQQIQANHLPEQESPPLKRNSVNNDKLPLSGIHASQHLDILVPGFSSMSMNDQDQANSENGISKQSETCSTVTLPTESVKPEDAVTQNKAQHQVSSYFPQNSLSQPVDKKESSRSPHSKLGGSLSEVDYSKPTAIMNQKPQPNVSNEILDNPRPSYASTTIGSTVQTGRAPIEVPDAAHGPSSNENQAAVLDGSFDDSDSAASSDTLSALDVGNAGSEDVVMTDVSDDKDIETFMNRSFDTLIQEFQPTLDEETGLEKMRVAYFDLSKKALAAFRVLCSVKGRAFQETIDIAAEQLEFNIDDGWDSIQNKHTQECNNVSDSIIHFSQVYTKLVQHAIKMYFVEHSSSFDYALTQAKSKTENSVSSRRNFSNKFLSTFRKQIELIIEEINKKAMRVHQLVSDFRSAMENKMSMFTCLSDPEFKKICRAYQTNAFNAFDIPDPNFRSILEDLVSKIGHSLEEHNTAIRNCEDQVAAHVMEFTIQLYSKEMEHFCAKKMHTSKALKDFHVKLAGASTIYFKDACRFHDCSGIEVQKYVSKLRTALDNMLKSSVTANSVKLLKAAAMLNKATTKAKREYRTKMNEKLKLKSLSEHQLRQDHEQAFKAVLTVYKLDIKEIAENVDEEIKTLETYFCGAGFLEFIEENAELKKQEEQKEKQERTEKERLRQIEEQKRREAETKRQAELKKQRQEAAVKKEQEKQKSAGKGADTAVATNMPSTHYVSGVETGIEPGSDVAVIPGIAIELGLQFIRVGYMHPTDGPKIILLEDGVEAMPAMIGVEQDELVIGSPAFICEQKIILGEIVKEMKAFFLISLFLEKKEVKLRLEEITALVLIHVKQKCEAFLHQPISDVILIIPSWYNHELRQATKHAAELAGFLSNRLITEAGAAALGWWWKNKATVNRTTKLLVAVASDFGFDAAGFEIDNSTVVMKTIINNGNISLGFKSALKKKAKHAYNLWVGNKSAEVNDAADRIVQKALSSSWLSEKEADHCIFLETRGYQGHLSCSCLSKYSRETNTNTDEYSLLGGTIYTTERRSKTGERLKEVLIYNLSCQNWTKGIDKICETPVALGGFRKFEVDLSVRITARTQININILETIGEHNRHLGELHVEPPDSVDECKKFKLNFGLTSEGILSVEAKYGLKPAVVTFTTHNLALDEMDTSKAKIQHLLESMGSAKACQEALQNLMAIERDLKKHVQESSKILEILKPAIVKEIDKTMASINDRSKLAEIEEAINKLTKYSDKYIKH